MIAVTEMLPIISATIQPTEEHSGCVFFKDAPIHIANEEHRRFSVEKQRTYLEAHALSSLAGSLAEFEHYRAIGKPKPEKWIGTNQIVTMPQSGLSDWSVQKKNSSYTQSGFFKEPNKPSHSTENRFKLYKKHSCNTQP